MKNEELLRILREAKENNLGSKFGILSITNFRTSANRMTRDNDNKISDWKKTSTFSLKICIISVHTIKTVVQKRLCNTFFLLEFTLPRKIIILFKTQKWHLNLGIIQMFYFVKIQKFLRKLRWKLCRSSPHASFREPKEALRRSRANHHHGQDRLQGCFYQRVRIFAILQLFPDFFKLQVSVRLSVDNRVRLSGECRENIFFSLFE